MKKEYKTPEIEITRFQTEDILNGSDKILNANNGSYNGTHMDDVISSVNNGMN